MNAQQRELLDSLLAMRSDLEAYEINFCMSARFCPDPWAKNLDEISKVFLSLGMFVGDMISQAEALFDSGGNDILENIETPGN